MSEGNIGVAISTTGHEHRMGFLETAVRNWDRALPTSVDASLFITVDGDEQACERVRRAVEEWTGSVFRVGQREGHEGRLGVAVNKNTGIELLMDAAYPPVEHLFLSDDDCSPRNLLALTEHMHLGYPHSMVCWGKGRAPRIHAVRPRSYVEWSWPRGVMLYAHRSVIEKVGGMDERFGIGGHEHAEWSRRIHQHGLTPVPYITPAVYARWHNSMIAMGAAAFWKAEDMPPRGNISSIERKRGDWENAEKVMAQRDGDTSFVPYQASSWGRGSATLCEYSPSQGAEESK